MRILQVFISLLILFSFTLLFGKDVYHKEYNRNNVKIVISEIGKLTKFRESQASMWPNYSLEISIDNTIIKKEEPIDRLGIIETGITDLDEDGNIEIFIYWKSEGTAALANLSFYELVGYELTAYKIPDPNPNIRNYFRGKDELKFENGYIIHKFPAYNENDANCCPSAGEVETKYSFRNDQISEVGYFLKQPEQKADEKNSVKTLVIKQINGLPSMDAMSDADCWLQIMDGNGEITNTETIRDNNSPQINKKFEISINKDEPIKIKVFDKDMTKDELIGEVFIKEPKSGTYPIMYETSEGSIKKQGEIEIIFENE